ncbi:hypothetical protein GCM10010885_01160 [Alicyclobacillus cellulosilyticus]|uniref:HTH merR-type domain-containing protein n=1 Tax=Alicyclobacillus cellulosilyticus TaxID=1003997 RepID=A0A917K032_9BACL|nr:MerR family transcriptional regulator [Alicyclobacillus cellulosilyticus]GGI95333.1 hypothetical protein GCM10010885_01160 [Alicyclobacillus cellulosilyticus]
MRLELLTITEIAKELGLPESTVRYYRDHFADVLPSIGHGRNRRYLPAALAMLRHVAAEVKRGVPLDAVDLHALELGHAGDAAGLDGVHAAEREAAAAAAAVVPVRQTNSGAGRHDGGHLLKEVHALADLMRSVAAQVDGLYRTVGQLEAEVGALHAEVRGLGERMEQMSREASTGRIAARDLVVLKELSDLRKKRNRRRWWWFGGGRLAHK